jgi:hypothetical protein
MACLKMVAMSCIIFIVTGCTGYNMALTKGQTVIDTEKKPIALLTVKLFNVNRPSCQLDLHGAYIVPKPVMQCSSWDERGPNIYFAEDPFKSEKNEYNEYLLSFYLEPGINTIISLGVVYNIPLLVGAGASIPLYLETSIKPGSVTYLGHINAILRERKNDNEERAGLIPLIDAAIVGFSTGTFDVIIEDQFEKDLPLFISEFPGLQKVSIEKSILPMWVRPENRKSN